MKKTLITLLMVLLCAMLIISCSNEPKDNGSSTTLAGTPTETPATSSNTVTFKLNGGSGDISSQTVVKDGKATKPADPTPSNANHYVFEFWTKEGETTEFDFANTAITADTTLVAKWKNKYKVGDTGPAGGKIFYVANTEQTSEYQSRSLTWKYLEAATSNASVGGREDNGNYYYQWSPSRVTCSTGTGIGSGWSNNLTLSGDNFSAAKACRDYSNNGISDWFLPSKDELLELYRQKEQIGGTFATDWAYWTSSMSDNGNAYTVAFSSGASSNNNPQSDLLFVRPIRAF